MSKRKGTKKAAKRASKKRSASKASTKRAAIRTSAKTSSAARSSAKSGRKAARLPAPRLRALPVYEFDAGGLLGYVRLTDPERGFEFSRCAGGRSLPTICKEVLSLRHYLARGQGGLLAPREEAECRGKVEKVGAMFRYDKVPRWPVTAAARYELLPKGGLDATFAFDFRKGLEAFEAGIETLLPGGQPRAYVHAGGRWVAAAAGPRLQRFYPRNMAVAGLIADGRWNGLRMAGLGLAVEPQGYDYPMVVVWDGHSGWALAQMALTEECSSVWVNGADRTMGLGLVGADVKARSAVTCRVRALLCRAEKLDDVLPHYREFVQQARTTRRR